MSAASDRFPGPVTAADVTEAVDHAVAALSAAASADWSVPAAGLVWTCWETAEHLCDDLFSYAAQIGPKAPSLEKVLPLRWKREYPEGPANALFVDREAGPEGLLQVLEAGGAILAAMVAATPATVRSHHVYGAADPEGFGAMGVVETLAHTFDVATGLGVAWDPPGELCDRALYRLFPDAPDDPDRWQVLLWCTGRGELPGRPRRTDWRWHGEVRTDQGRSA